jgi:hypothetical protein
VSRGDPDEAKAKGGVRLIREGQGRISLFEIDCNPLKSLDSKK